MSRRKSVCSTRRVTFELLEDRRLLAVSPEWLVTVGGPNFDLFPYVAAHDAGGFSATGRFAGTTDFDPGPVDVELTSSGPQTDIVVARYTDAGELLWARWIGDSDPNHMHLDTGVATDRLGNTYVLGIFEGSVELGSQTLIGDGSDGFVAKLDPEGNFLWAQAMRATSSTVSPRDVQGIAVDDRDADPANWSVFVSGAFSGTATIGGQTYRSMSNSYDTFVSKLSAGSGGFQWTRTISGKESQRPVALAMAETAEPGLYMSGDYDTELKVGGVTLTGPAGSHFLAKLNPSDGSTIWAKTVAVAATYGSLAATADGVVVGGNFSTSADFDPGAGVVTLTSAGGGDAALLKLDTSGNFLWAQRMGGADAEFTQGLAVNAAGSVFLTGEFRGTADFGGQMLTTEGANDGFVAELDAAGSFVGAYQFPDIGHSAAVDGAGNVFVAAGFSGSALDHFPTGDSAVSRGGLDIALLKFSPSATPINPTPSIHTFFATPQTVFAGDSFTLSVIRVHDPDRRFQTIAFYRDNGSGVLEPMEDILVGSDANPSGGWVVTASAVGLTSGTYKFFAQASDIDGVVLAEAAIDVEVIEVAVVNYASTDVPQSIPDVSTATSTLTVPDSFSILDIDVAVNISHTYAADLDVYLIAPDGTRVTLFTDVGGSGDNFSDTILDDEAVTPITSGTAPFTGRFRPQTALIAFDSKDAAGVWTLEIIDDARKNKGTLNNWSLTFTREAAPLALAASSADENRAAASRPLAFGTADFDPGPGTYKLTSAGGADFFVAKLTQPSLLLVSSMTSDSSDSLLASDGAAQPIANNDAERAAALDLALAELNPRRWPKMLAEILPAIC